MLTGIKLVIFDLDGTLVDAYKAIAQSLNRSLKELNYPLASEDEIRRQVGWGQRYLMECFVKKDDIDRALSIYRQYHKQDLKSGLKFLPGAKELLIDLKNQNFNLAVASNRPTRFSQTILKQLNIQKMIDYVLCPEEGIKPKPSADILLHVLRKFELNSHQAVYVGDMPIDIEAGKNAGITTIGVSTGSSTKEELKAAQPDYILEKISEVRNILEKTDN